MAGSLPQPPVLLLRRPRQSTPTCSGQVAAGAALLPVRHSAASGCLLTGLEYANSQAEALACGRAHYGDAFEETWTEFRGATGPNGCSASTVPAGDEDKALRCATSLCGVGCESEIGECP